MEALKCFKIAYAEGGAEEFQYAVVWHDDELKARFAFLNVMGRRGRTPTIASVEQDYEIKKGMVWVW